MKGMRIAVAVLAVLIVVALGVTLFMSGGGGGSERPRRESREESPAPAPEPRRQAADNGEREVEAPSVEPPSGYDENEEERKYEQLDQQARQAMASGNYQESIEARLEQMKSAVRLGQVVETAKLYHDIAHAQFLLGNFEKAEQEISNALIMADVGEEGEHIKDDVELLRASIAIKQGNMEEAENKLKEARQKRREIEGEGHRSMAEITLHEALLADLRGDYEQADQLYDKTLSDMLARRSSGEGKQSLEKSRWIFRESASIREENLQPGSEAVQQAAKRLEAVMAE